MKIPLKIKFGALFEADFVSSNNSSCRVQGRLKAPAAGGEIFENTVSQNQFWDTSGVRLCSGNDSNDGGLRPLETPAAGGEMF